MVLLTDSFVQNFEGFVLREEGKVKDLVKEFKEILDSNDTPKERQEITHELSALFQENKYIDEEGKHVGIKYAPADKQLDKFKQAAAKKLGGKKENLKNLVLGVYGLQTEFKASALQPILPEDPKAMVNPNDPNRFQNLVSKKNPFVHGIVGSTYSGEQLIEEEHRHTEDSVLVQTFYLNDGTKVTLGGIGDGIGNHVDAADSRACARASKFAIKHGLRSMAAILQKDGVDVLTPEHLEMVFNEIFVETKNKYNPSPSNVPSAATTVSLTALVERPDGRNSLHLVNLGDCMILTYNKKKGFLDSKAGAVHRGLGPAGIPSTETYNPKFDIPYTRVLELGPNEIPIILSDGAHDAYKLSYQLKAPLEFLTENNIGSKEIDDKIIESDGVVLADLSEEKVKELKELDAFKQGQTQIIGNLDGKHLEDRINVRQKPMDSAQTIARSLFEIAIEGTNEQKQNLPDHGVKGHGDDLSIIVMAPESAIEQEVSKGKLDKFKAAFSRS